MINTFDNGLLIDPFKKQHRDFRFTPCSELIKRVNFHARYQLMLMEQAQQAKCMPQELHAWAAMLFPGPAETGHVWTHEDKCRLVSLVNELDKPGRTTRRRRGFWKVIAAQLNKNSNACSSQFQNLLTHNIIQKQGDTYYLGNNNGG